MIRFSDLAHAIRALLSDKLRAALTLLGIVIGTSSIVVLSSLLTGGEAALVRMSQEAVESDLVEVRRADPPESARTKTRRTLSRDDAVELGRSDALAGTVVQTQSSRSGRATLEGRTKHVTLVGAGPEALELFRLTVQKGRFLQPDDLTQGRRVAVVGNEVWKELLQERDDIGNTHVSVDGGSWAVVGLLAAKPILGATDSTNIWDRKILVPQSSYDATHAPAHEVDRIYVRKLGNAATLTTPIETLRAMVDSVLFRRHLGVRDYEVQKQRNTGQERLILDVVKMMLLGTGVLALGVGGINIMNIMLVTVTERTREIGVRRAVGATPARILFQLLVESGTLSLLGGVLGVLWGVAVAWVGSAILNQVVGNWPFAVQPAAIGVGLALSLLTGVVFGLYPAWRASRMNPIEALRFE